MQHPRSDTRLLIGGNMRLVPDRLLSCGPLLSIQYHVCIATALRDIDLGNLAFNQYGAS